MPPFLDEEEQQAQDPLDASIARQQAARTAQLDVATRSALGTSPQRAAEVEDLSRQTGLSRETVERNFDTIKKSRAASEIEPQRMVRETPALAGWLSKQGNAAVASDDHANLADLERHMSLSSIVLRGIDNLQGMLYGGVEGAGQLVGSNGLIAFGREGRARNKKEAAAYGEGTSFSEAFQGPWDMARYLKEQLGDQVPILATSAATGIVGAKTGAVAGAPFGPVGVGIGTTLGGLIGAFGPSFLMGMGQVKQEAADIEQQQETTQLTPDEEAKFEQWVQANKITDVDDPESHYDYRGYWKDVASKGKDQTQMQADGRHFPDTYKQHGHPTFSVESKYSKGPEDGGHWEGETFIPPTVEHTPGSAMATLVGGSFIGALDAWTPGVKIGSRLVKTFGKEMAEEIAQKALTSQVRPGLIRMAAKGASRSFASEAVTESLQEAIQAVTAAHGMGANVNWSELPQRMLEAGIAGGVTGGVFGGAEGAFEAAHQQKQFAAAQQQKQFFTNLGATASNSETIKRAPDAVAQFIAEKAATLDEPVKDVYWPTDTFINYFQSKGIDPALVAEQLTKDPRALTNAVESGEDLSIPIENYATMIAPTEHNAFAAAELKMRPDLMNIRESQEYVARQKAAQGEEITAQDVKVTPEQIAAAGRPMSEARRLSALLQAGFDTIGERMNARQLFDAYDVNVGKANVPGVAAQGETLQQSFTSVAPHEWLAAKEVTKPPFSGQAETAAFSLPGGQRFEVEFTTRRDGMIADVDFVRSDILEERNRIRQALMDRPASEFIQAVRREGLGDPYGITGGGGAIQVFATVIATIREYLTEHPEVTHIAFKAKEKSRQRLYEHLLKRIGVPFTHQGEFFTAEIDEWRKAQGEYEALAAKARDGGFTYNVVDKDSPTEGYAVSTFKGLERKIPVDTLTADAIQKYVRDNKEALEQPNAHLGAWFNPDDGNVYLDVSTIVATPQEADQLARTHEQLAYYGLREGQSFDVGRPTAEAGAAAVPAGPGGAVERQHPEPRAGPEGPSQEQLAEEGRRLTEDDAIWGIFLREPLNESDQRIFSLGRTIYEIGGGTDQAITSNWVRAVQQGIILSQSLRETPTEIKDGALLVSTRVPSATGPAREPGADILTTRLSSFLSVPAKLAQAARTFEGYDLLTEAERAEAKTDEETVVAAVNAMKRNLAALWNRFPSDLRERATHWYLGANRIAHELAASSDVSVDQTAAVLAGLSPQMDWFKNVNLAERLVGVVSKANKTNPKFDKRVMNDYRTATRESMEAYLATKRSKAAKGLITFTKADERNYRETKEEDIRAVRRAFFGKRWKELTIEGKARYVRMVDERTSRDYQIISPEGDKAGPALNKDGSATQVAWGNYDVIEGAIAAMLDNSHENISRQLGLNHKVRSFFNNISYPREGRSVTIDTHAVAAAFMQPFSQEAAPVLNAMGHTSHGGGGLVVHAPSGIKGTNGIIAEAYFQLASELGVPVDALQSVTWEAVRGIFKPEQKKGPQGKILKGQVAELYARYENGELSHEDLVDGIIKAAGGIERPAWADTPISEQGAMVATAVGPRESAVADTGGGAGARPVVAAGSTPTVRGRAERALRLSQAETPEESLGQVSIDRATHKFNVTLFEKADPTTMVHEIGHIFFELLGDAAEHVKTLDPGSLTEGQQGIARDYQALLDHVGATGREGLTRSQHEQIAREFEAYIMEGKAPSKELRPVFQRLRAFMLGVYRKLRSLNADLKPEVREIFDRMLATDSALEAVREENPQQQIFTTPESAGMTPRQFERYRAAVTKASFAARERLDREMLADVQRRKTEEWDNEHNEIAARIKPEVQQQPVYRALAAIRKGTAPDGSLLVEGQAAEPMKLDKRALVAMFGKERVRNLPRPFIYTTEGGLDPEYVARQFGYSSADQMLGDIERAPGVEAEVDRRADAEMQARHGDLVTEGGALDAAREALAGSQREAVIREELRALNRLKRTVGPFERAARAEGVQAGKAQLGPQVAALKDQLKTQKTLERSGGLRIRQATPDRDTVREAARARLAGMPAARIRPLTYWLAAGRAAKEAVQAAARHDWDKAIDAHHTQLLALELYKQANAAQEDVEKRVERVESLLKATAQERLGRAGYNIREQILGVMERYGFAPKSNVEVSPMKDWLASMDANGQHVEPLPPELMTDSREQDYKTLTYDELKNVTDGITQLVHVAREVNKATTAAQDVTFGEQRDRLAASIEAARPPRPRVREFRTPEERKHRIAGMYGSLRKMANLAFAMDDYKPGGEFVKNIIRPMNEAADEKFVRSGVEGKKLSELKDRFYTREEQRHLGDKLYIPAIDESLSKEARLAILLNMGNVEGRERILSEWNPQQVRAIIDSLDERDGQFAQAMWNYLDTLRPEAFALLKRANGVAPERVVATPVETNFGVLKGGYYPIEYEGRLSPRFAQVEELNDLKMSAGRSYLSGMTRTGFAEHRQAHTGLPIKLDLGVAFNHVEEVVHALTHFERMRGVAKLLRDKRVAKAINDRFGPATYEQFKSGVQDVVQGGAVRLKGMEPAVRFMRTRAQLAGLALNLWSATQQPSGVFNGMQRVGPRWVIKGMTKFMAHPESTLRWIYDTSTLMKSRAETMQQDLGDVRQEFLKKGGWFDTMLRKYTNDTVSKETIVNGAMWFISTAQRFADVPTWLGAYERSMAEQGDEQEAIKQADQAVIDTQGSAHIKDLANVQRGGEWARAFMTFYSYGSTTINQAADIVGEARQRKTPAAVLKALGGLFLLYGMPGFWTIAAGVALGRQKGPDEDKDESWLGYFLKEVGGEALSTALNGIPIVREAAGLFREGNRGYSGPASTRMFENVYNLKHQIEQGELDSALLNAALSTAGSLTGIPVQTLKKNAQGLIALIEGETKNPGAVVVGTRKQ